MSTSLTNIKGIYRKVTANNEARLKYTYVAGITDPATKSLALFSIPFANTVENTSMFGLVSSTDDAEQINKTFNGTQYESNIRFDSLDKMMSRPNTSEFNNGPRFISEGKFCATSVAINDDIFFSVLFETDVEVSDDVYIVCHEKANDIPVSAIKMTDSSVVSLGNTSLRNNLYVTKLNSSFKIKNNNDGQALNNFPLPYFTIANFENGVYRRLNVDFFKIHDIAICACLNQ